LRARWRRAPLLFVDRGAPAIAPASLGVVEFAPSALGGSSLFDGERRLGRIAPSLGRLFARLQAAAPFIPLGRANSRLQPVHVEDVAQAVVNALTNAATRAGLTSWPLTSTRPRLTSSLASVRVL